MKEKKHFWYRCGMRFVMPVLFCLCMTGTALAGGPKKPPVYYSGKVEASRIKSDGNFNRDVQIDGAYLNLILDTDLVLTRLEPAPGYEDTNLTIMSTGNYTFTLDSLEEDEWNDSNPQAALKAGSLVIKGVSNMYARGRWYAILAKNYLNISSSTVKAESANVDLCTQNGDMWIQDSVIDCTYKSGSNGVNAVYGNLTILDSTVQAYGGSSGVRGNTVNLENSSVNASSGCDGISSNADMTIKGCTIQADVQGSGECTNWAGICANYGSLTITSSDVTATGNPSGIYGGTPSGSKILIQGGTVRAAGTKSAISSANPLQISDDLTIREPAGGKAGKTTWEASLPYGIVTADSKTVSHVVIGPPPEEADPAATPTGDGGGTSGSGTSSGIPGSGTPTGISGSGTSSGIPGSGTSTGVPGSGTPSGGSGIQPGSMNPGKNAAASALEKVILSQPDDNDVKGSVFSLLQAKGVPKSGTSIKLTWKKVKGATKYVVYGNECGRKNRYKKIKEVTGTSFTQKKLKKGTYYKYIIVAVGNSRELAVSKTIHVATAGGRAGNDKAVKVNKKRVTIRRGKTFRIAASGVPESAKRKVHNHRKLAYESSDPTKATVSKKGVIRGVSKGRCTVYVYAQNGARKAIKVTVK